MEGGLLVVGAMVWLRFLRGREFGDLLHPVCSIFVGPRLLGFRMAGTGWKEYLVLCSMNRLT